MIIGILVNTDKHLDDIVGITQAAISKGHEVSIFAMDDGTRLIEKTPFTELCKIKGVKMSFCDHSAIQLGTSKEGVPKEITCGSQFDNANMHHDSDKVIVL